MLYDLIYADPPWKYGFSRSSRRKIENHYETMGLDEIKSYSVPAKPNSLLFLWATAPKLIEALSVMMAWGFEYKTHLVWDKGKIGMGYWCRGQHELLLVGVRGKFSPPSPNDRIGSIYREVRTAHSAKPKGMRNWIEKAFPTASKIELFARDRYEGWDAEGYEIESHGEKTRTE